MQKCLSTLKSVLISAALILSLGNGFKPPPAEPNEFHFVVLGDSQFHDPPKFNRLIDQTRLLQPAFVIQVGDLIKGYNNDLDAVRKQWRRFSRQIAPLAPIPFLAVPGNHDLYNGNRKVDARLEKLFGETWGGLYYAFTYKNTLLIVLNSDSTEGANQITGRQLDWLKATLAGTEQRHKMVFLHRPPLLMHNAGMLHDLFQQYGVSHVFYGHHHHYHFFEQDGIAYTMTNAAADSEHDHDATGSFHHLLQVSIRGEAVQVAAIKADAIMARDAVHPDDNYDMFDLSRRLAPSRVELELVGGTEFTMTIPLFNASDRDVQVLVSCGSEDNRWRFTPGKVNPLSLVSGARQQLQFSVSFSPERVPETQPVCDVKVPFQTVHGQWLDFTRQVTGRR